MKKIVLLAIGIALAPSTSFAAQCGVRCLNDKVTALTSQLESLKKQVGEIKVPAVPNFGSVRLESTERHQCLTWVDNATAPRTINCDANNHDQIWNVH